MVYAFAATGNVGKVDSWSGLPLYACMTAGIFGALFSRLLYLQMNWDALSVGGLKDAREFTSILLRACVGMTGAVIVSFFLQSNVVGAGCSRTSARSGSITRSMNPRTARGGRASCT